MKLVKTANGKQTVKLSKSEWESVGKKSGWTIAKKKAKDYKYNPWAVCHTTVDKDEDPEKYERCVNKVKKQQKKANNNKLPMPLYDDITEIEGKIMAWVERYMNNYPEEQWSEKQAIIYKKIAEFCMNEASALSLHKGY